MVLRVQCQGYTFNHCHAQAIQGSWTKGLLESLALFGLLFWEKRGTKSVVTISGVASIPEKLSLAKYSPRGCWIVKLRSLWRARKSLMEAFVVLTDTI